MKDLVSNHQMRTERQKAKELKKSRWWQNKIQITSCYYCNVELNSDTATMDHVVPISRGGLSKPGNLVPACHQCNLNKRSMTAVEWTLHLENQKKDANKIR